MESQSTLTFQSVHLNYIRNSRAIAVLWCVFTICFAIINIVVFLHPWLGDTDATKNEGYFGLYEACRFETSTYQVVGAVLNNRTDTRLICEGAWNSISSALNPYSTVFIGVSCLANLTCIAVFLVLFLFVNPLIVFNVCAILQLISTICMIIGCVVYPYNWGKKIITDICETSSSYFSGKCHIRWAYILAIIGIFDVLFLCILAFVLARRQATDFPEGPIIQEQMDNDGFDRREEQRRSKTSFQDFQL